MASGIIDHPQHRTLEQLDQRIDEIKRGLEDALPSFGDALREVKSRPEIDESAQIRLDEVAARLKGMQPEIKELDFDVEQSAALFSSILDVDRAIARNGADLDRFEQIILGVERIRQIIRDALDEFTGGRAPDRRSLVSLLRSRLPGVSQVELAELLGADPRTVNRWSQSAGEPSHRLRLVAQLVQILHHAWTPAGVMAWFSRSREELGGRAPIVVLDEPAFERDLIAEARGSRNQYGG